MISTRGYRHVLRVARSFVLGGLGTWLFVTKTPPPAPMSLTAKANQRIGVRGKIIETLDEDDLRDSLRSLKIEGIDALTISLINSDSNDWYENIVGSVAAEELLGNPVSLSSRVVRDMQEYEYTITTACNSYVRPIVSRYVRQLSRELGTMSGGLNLHILCSDRGRPPPVGAEILLVNLPMSGPAGGVTAALWIARQAGFDNVLSFDMGGTTDRLRSRCSSRRAALRSRRARGGRRPQGTGDCDAVRIHHRRAAGP